MTVRRGAAALCGALTLAVVACGAEDRPDGAAGPAKPLTEATCSPVTYGGPGQPQFLIVVHAAFQGPYKGHGVQTSQAVKMILAERKWRAGPYRIGMQACEETEARQGRPSPSKCGRNARAIAENRTVIGMIGPATSSCAVHMLPTLNAAPGGPVPVVSSSNTYIGLTRSGPGTAPDEPKRYQPGGRSGYVRLAPTDDVQGAANALFAERHGAKRAFVVQDGSAYGRGLAAAFEDAAGRLDLEVAGSEQWSGEEKRYVELARRVRAARPDTVLVAGDIAANGPRLIADLAATLGPGVQLMGGDSFNQSEPLVEAAGPDVEGLVISIAVLPNGILPPAGRRFAGEFARRFSQRPCCFSVHDAQGTGMLLDAIAKSGGSRARAAETLATTRVTGGLIGDFAIDRNGDTTLNTIAMYRIRTGRLKFETALTPASDLLGRE